MSDATQSLSLDRAPADFAPAEAMLFLVLQGDELQAPSLRIRLGGLTSLAIGRGEAQETREDGASLRLSLPDAKVSTTHCALVPSAEGLRLEDKSSKNGSFVNGREVKSALLADGDVIELGRTFLVYRQRCSARTGEPRVVRASSDAAALGLTSLVPALAVELQKLRDVSRSSVPVIVHGETGTGKELIAAGVHAHSGRSGPFVAVNCGSLQPDLLAAELFGHKKGAFSGAVEERPGLVRAADRGTLFLDEIADLPPAGQSALLRVLQEGEVLPLGSTKPIKVDVRIVAATHRDLEQLVAKELFRADLLARLQGFTLRLPPLRERLTDLGLLVAGILRRRLPDQFQRVRLGNLATRALLASAWPLNVRELEKALLAAVALSKDGSVELFALPSSVREPPAPRDQLGKSPDLEEKLRALLLKHQGNVTAVAAELGKDRVQIRRWMKKLGMDAQAFRDDPEPT
ncbi:MAG: sigma 54-interacting transcriptional regulator [Deltaproteobacteria bacterium]|nr:sigma 54-interacting transcriptional regulator [Deltaproteobacteria bacterium]